MVSTPQSRLYAYLVKSASYTKHPAILNGHETTAFKVNGVWLVGGDRVSKGDNVLIAALEWRTKRPAWHKLKGNRLIFDDFLDSSELKRFNLG